MTKPPLPPFLPDLATEPLEAERLPDRCADDPAQAGTRGAMHLGDAELFVVGTLRAWVAPIMRPGQPHPDWQELCRLAGVGTQGTSGFDTLMSVIAAQAKRLIDVHCCRCPGLGGDEAAMLCLVAALQAGETLAALDVLRDWLPDVAVGPALHAARRFALHTGKAGLTLPRRGQVIAFPTPRTLH
jgi:hypothetical protein